MAAVAYTSCSGTLALLEEHDADLKNFALSQLNEVVNTFWTEIADSITKIESLYEDDSFPNRDLAALVASKVYYHLGEYDEALSLALGAGELFDVRKSDEYTDTLMAKAIENYTAQSRTRFEGLEENPVDPRLEAMVERLVQRCYDDGEFKQALGIGLEARRLDIVERSLNLASNTKEMLQYCFDVSTYLPVRSFRHDILRVLVRMFLSLDNPDFLAVFNCLVFLDDTKESARILDDLLKGDDEHLLTAYQVAFGLCDTSPQHFLGDVRERLPEVPETAKDSTEDTYETRLYKLKEILTGRPSIELHLDFLYRKNRSDLLILKGIKEVVEARNSVYHNATVISNAIMHCGTTVDQFLRDNLEWLGKAANWAKFSATASLGVIHKGQLKESLSVLAPYLPGTSQTGNASPYVEGGSLYALGIIHSNHGDDMTHFLLNSLRNTASANLEVVQHGACLGLGLAAIGTGSPEIYSAIQDVLTNDNAISGEAAGIAAGLVMLGTAAEDPVKAMLAHAQETRHEKIIRGLAMGISLTMYGREDQADPLIDTLIADKDPILRYGGMYTIGMAYAGTSSNAAIRKLLHVAVSDVSDDVRRAATLNLGFVLVNRPEQTPRLVSLLAESYNPHVRYGAALAVGIACAGSGMKEALDLLLPLTKDPVDFVRQGSLIALAMVLMQLTQAQEPRVKEVRELFDRVIRDRHEEVMTRFGAILATGIIDAGGRNCTIALHRGGRNKMRGIVGIALFTQYWFWFPMIHCIALALEPTAIIGLNKDLAMPKFSFKSNAKPSLFAYPASIKPPEKKEQKKLPTAVLSTTLKAKARAEKKKAAKEAEGGDVAMVDVKTEEKEVKPEEKPKKEEPKFETLENPARVTPAQSSFITFDVDERYSPLVNTVGIVMLKDNKPEEKQVIVARKVGVEESEEDEPAPPEAFTWP